MKQYIGTKRVNATPMTRKAYNDLRGWEVPADEDGADEGYLVEYTDGGKANHPDFAGYISWSPKGVFERAYDPIEYEQIVGTPLTSQNFGQAVALLKKGYRVSREGWNGKGMFLYYVPEASYPAQRNAMGTMVGVFPDDMVPYRAYIAMKTAQNDVVPWVASQSDILATDWMLIA